MNEEIELLDSQEPAEVAVDQEPEQQPETSTPEVDAAALAEKNKQLFARAKKAEQEAAELKAKLASKPETTNQPLAEDRIERLELQVKGYSDDEIEFLMPLGGKKALSNEIVTTAIEQLRAKKKSADATPSSGGKSPVYKKFTQAELDAMSIADLEKILPHAS